LKKKNYGWHLPTDDTLKNSLNFKPNKSINNDQLIANLQSKNLKMVAIDGDGNCQFASVADQLHQIEIFRTAATLRKEAVSLIANSPLIELVDHNERANFVPEMSKDGVWGNMVTLIAMAINYRCNIKIITGDIKYDSTLYPNDFGYPPTTLTLTIGYLVGLHYCSTSH